MKFAILTFAMATALSSAQNASACTIMPKGDSALRVQALHETLGDMEVLNGLHTLDGAIYQLTVQNYDSDTKIVRKYKLENTSPMCPEYKATLID